MKKFLSKAAAYLLAIALILATETLLPAGMSVKAAGNTVVNVYDATTFGEMLKTENTDILLWQDIDYTGQDLVFCNSIDLNGYRNIFREIICRSLMALCDLLLYYRLHPCRDLLHLPFNRRLQSGCNVRYI